MQELPGRRLPLGGDAGSHPVSPSIDDGAFAGHGQGAEVDLVSPSPRISSTPRLGGGGRSPQIGQGQFGASKYHRKSASTSVYDQPPSKGIFGFLFPSSQPTLPGPTTGRRQFYDPSKGGATSAPGISLRGVILRPFYVLGRRGIVLLLVVVTMLYIMTASSSSNSSGVTRMKRVVEPYIPRGAKLDAAGLRERLDAIVPANPDLLRARADEDEVIQGADLMEKMEAQRKKKVMVGVRQGAAKGGAGGAAAGAKKKAGSKLKARSKHALRDVGKRKDGRIVVVEGEEHPIGALMDRAREKWDALKDRQSKTFKEAVAEYIRRHKRKPPKGFDQWYAFAKANNVLLIDEFDLISKDMELYHAFDGPSFRKRVDHLSKTFDKIWGIRVTDGKPSREGELFDHNRAIGVVDLMKRFVHLLPDMLMIYNGHDGARVGIVAEERERLESLAAKGLHDDTVGLDPVEKGPPPHWGMSTFCPPGSAVREAGFEYGWPDKDSTGLEMPPLPEGSIGTLIEDFSAYLDVCNSPQYRHFHATTSWVYSHQPPVVMPLLTPGVQTRFGDIHSIIIEQFDLEQLKDFSWEERPFGILQWRGQTSGPYWESSTPWKTTQRARLHLLSHQEEGNRKYVITDEEDVSHVTESPNVFLNPMFLDTGMVGPAVQCKKEDGTCDDMDRVFGGYDRRISFDRAALYKYVLDVDGNSWSGRFRRLMLSNAAVVKATVFPEFWTDWCIPWLHFIPMQVDYSDMWDIMAFFRGGVDGEGAHDDWGKEIAEAGKEWVMECYRWEDLEAYQFRLMLEYGRVYNDETEPGSLDYNGDGSEEPVWHEVWTQGA
ncbi:capsular associated protein, glycosyltransferase family 90 protein [Pseudohyphozyma bogoriensis]|nr:capsular associated protein, glycosyltransferase family 90 protein [Pseudohyphozyma bogoriensis]